MNADHGHIRIKRADDKPVHYMIVFLVIIVILLLLRKPLAVLSLNFFIFFDRLLSFGSQSSFAGWILLGFITGLLYGTIVAIKKYKLKARLLLFPIAAALLCILTLFLANRPLKSIYVPEPIITTEGAYNYIEVTATGHMAQYGKITYAEGNLIDVNDSTAWIENAKQAGIGYRIEFIFGDGVAQLKHCQCIGFRFKNGYIKSKSLWQSHNRIKEFMLYHNDTAISTIPVQDGFNVLESIAITPIEIKSGDRLALNITAIYKGTKHPDQTAITELVPVIAYQQ